MLIKFYCELSLMKGDLVFLLLATLPNISPFLNEHTWEIHLFFLNVGLVQLIRLLSISLPPDKTIMCCSDTIFLQLAL